MSDLSQSLEDYLEMIWIISKKQKTVRVKDLMKELDVKSASVIGAIKKLKSIGLVEQEHYGYIDLTSQGIQEAKKIYEKHQVLFRFMRDILNVEPEIAEKDACRLEHYISEETYRRLISFSRFIEYFKDSSPLLQQQVKDFLEKDLKGL